MTNAKSLAQINKALNIKYPNLELVKGKGYFYLIAKNDEGTNQLLHLDSTSIYSYRLSNLSVDQWVRCCDEMIKGKTAYCSDTNFV